MSEKINNETSFRIIENAERKTLTIILGGVRFFSAKFLLELYEEDRYFGNGMLLMGTENLRNLLLGISSGLNNVRPEVKTTPKMFFEGVDYPLIRRKLDQNEQWDKLSYELSLTVFAKGKARDLFFEDLARTKPVRNEQVIKEHVWGVEIELSSSLDDNGEPRVFVILHRIIKGKKTSSNFQSNDEAWGGFDFGVDEEEVSTKDVDLDDDLPF